MWGRKWGSMWRLLACWRGLLALQVAHQFLVELIFRFAGLLVSDGRTFIVFERHADIVAHGGRFNHEGWPPSWMALQRKFIDADVSLWAELGTASGNDRDPKGPRPAIWSRGSVPRPMPGDRAWPGLWPGPLSASWYAVAIYGEGL
jgi:hypothetical protein